VATKKISVVENRTLVYPGTDKSFSLFNTFQTNFLFKGHRISFQGVKLARRQVDCSSPTSAGVKNEWNYNSSPTICLLGVDRDNFTFTFTLSSRGTIPKVLVRLIFTRS